MSYVVSVAPTEEPVSLLEVKDHLNITEDFSDDDGLLSSLIVLAREFVENYTRRALLTQTLVARYNSFLPYFRMERPPLKSVSQIQYIDTDGNTQVLDSSVYDVDQYSTPGKITLAYGQTWPSTRTGVPNTVIITYVAGETEPTAVPTALKHAILMLVGHFYENREATNTLTIKDVPFSVSSLMTPYKVY